MAGENPNAEKLRENDAKAKAQSQPKSLLHHSKGKGGKKKSKKSKK